MTPTLAPSLARQNGSRQAVSPTSMTFDLDGNTITVTLEMIGPDLAAHYLMANTHNRTRKPRSQAKYVADMTAGKWQFTGAPISFDTNGVLLDGQNRLHSICEAEVTLPVLVVRGLPAETQMDMDSGNPRKFVDVLTLSDEPPTNVTLVAAIVRKIYGWEQGDRRNLGKANPSHSQLAATLAAHPDAAEFAVQGKRASRTTGLPPTLAGFAWWLFDSVDTEDAAFFFERLADGQGLVKGDPIFELRRTLVASANARGTERSQAYLLAITIKAWNAYRRGDTVAMFKWRMGGANPEAFPEPR